LAIRRCLSTYERHSLWDIEDIFRTAKSLLATRPIFHKYDETIRGHVFCSFLALVLRKVLIPGEVARGSGMMSPANPI
jgi:transposase